MPEILKSEISDMQLRAKLEEMVIGDLLGPAGGENEELVERNVRDRYLVGVLAPAKRSGQAAAAPAEEDEEETQSLVDPLAEGGADSLEEGTTELDVPVTQAHFPSSFGMTFCVDGSAKSLVVHAYWGQYKREVREDQIDERTGKPIRVWKRYPHGGKQEVPLREGVIKPLLLDGRSPDVFVQGQARRRDEHFFVTLFLVNGQEEGRPKDEFYVFQPELSVTAPDDAPIFTQKRQLRAGQNADAAAKLEEETMAMLYRHQVEFAVGHGVSVRVKVSEESADRAVMLKTQVVPMHEVARSTPPTEADAERNPAFARLKGLVLDMKELAEADSSQLKKKVGPLVAAYRTWIEGEEAKIGDPAQGLSNKFAGGSGIGTPYQLTNCPWCGSPIDIGKHLESQPFKQGRCRTITDCGDKFGQCLFSKRQAQGEGLPVLVVDEEIYRLLPSLLIATVDKFAQMPWKGEVQMLFGQVNGRCDRHGFVSPEIEDLRPVSQHPATRTGLPAAKVLEHPPLRPPDLIIQDELHLISGPLGTLVGLYETAIDRLCTWEVDGRKVRPKLVASTATIKNADAQVYKLFLRRVNLFPPHGLDVRDNFFSLWREPSEEYPGRIYLGICAPGRRLKAALIRVYVAFLCAAQALYQKEGYGAAVDPWMTLVGYFNSMRELGGMRRPVDDDVYNRAMKMDRRGLARRFFGTNYLSELTSRMRSEDIPLTLDRLEAPFDPELEEKRKAEPFTPGGRHSVHLFPHTRGD